jgi:hypothetical protein
MITARNRCILDLPDGWIRKDSDESIYFEAPDGRQGLYLASYEKNINRDDKNTVEFVIGIEKEKKKSMKGYDFSIKEEKYQEKDGFAIGYLDLYDKKNNYRIAIKCIVRLKSIYRISFNDYYCDNFKKSRKDFESVISSFEYNPKYKWAIGFPVNPLKFEEVIIDQEEGFFDIDFYIASCDLNNDGTISVSVRNEMKGKPVEFTLCFENKWNKKEIENSDNFFYWGKGKFINTGEYTDNFLKTLASCYCVPVKTPDNNKAIEAVIVGLANDPASMTSQAVDMKFFFNSDSEKQELYSEVYINVNIPERILQFHEKDPEYREPLIRSLCGET